jgi:hypothetical protein
MGKKTKKDFSFRFRARQRRKGGKQYAGSELSAKGGGLI